MLSGLRPASPGGAARQRLGADFEALLDTQPRPGWLRSLRSWLGVGPMPRPLVERLAASALLIGAGGSGAGAATGNSPIEAAQGVVQFVQSAAGNLDPRDGPQGRPGTATPTPTASPAASPTPSTTPAATGTVDHAEDDHGGDRKDGGSDDHPENDHSGDSSHDGGSGS